MADLELEENRVDWPLRFAAPAATRSSENMANTKDNAGDDLGRGMAGAFNLAGAAGDMLEFWRAMSDTLASARNRSTTPDDGSSGGETPPTDPVGLMVRIHALLLDGGVRYGLRWQELISGHLPAIRHSLDELRAGEPPTEEARNALLRDVREYFRAMAVLPCDLCREMQQELRALENELFPDDEPMPRRTHKYKP